MVHLSTTINSLLNLVGELSLGGGGGGGGSFPEPPPPSPPMVHLSTTINSLLNLVGELSLGEEFPCTSPPHLRPLNHYCMQCSCRVQVNHNVLLIIEKTSVANSPTGAEAQPKPSKLLYGMLTWNASTNHMYYTIP